MTTVGSYSSRLGSASPRPRSQGKSSRTGLLPPLQPMKSAEMLRPGERVFLEAAERGDKPTLESCLADKNLNVNCTDLLGRTAIEIAVDNENVEIVELLLRQKSIRIGNALLGAIREGVYRLVEMLINHDSITSDMLGEGWAKSLDPAEAASSEYASDISPVVLAAHLNQFEVLQLLLSRGANILKPHKLSCPCGGCEKERVYDSLHLSLRRINRYHALSSPAWISLTSSDPIVTAFRLSWELHQLSVREHEFKEVYVQLSDQCKHFACDLLSQCRSTEEVIAVLNKDNSNDDTTEIWSTKLSLARLKLAIKYDQKQFVSHPHCQQLLTSIWYEGFPGRRERGSVINIFVCFVLILLWPVLACCYIVCPRSRVGRIVRSPFMKFLYYSASFGCFLFLLTLATFEDYRYEQGSAHASNIRAWNRGPDPTAVEWFIFVWVLGMVWSEVKQLWEEGFHKYAYQYWNWLDFIMMSLYLSTFALRLAAWWLLGNGRPVERSLWHADEPMLVSEALFAVANVFSFARIIYLFQTNPYLGPLQISLGCMLLDVAKFFFLFFLILSSFSIGLAQLYWYYEPSDCDGANCQRNSDAFSTIFNSYTTLIWSLFSITNPRDTAVVERHALTQWVGQTMFIAYHMTSIIVLLNMLIAMMSHSFQVINDHKDLEWKFHRTKLWMGHFDEGCSLAPPFNIVITPKSLFYLFRFCYNTARWCCGRYEWRSRQKRATIRRPGFGRRRSRSRPPPPPSDVQNDSLSERRREPLTYQDIMHRLVARFIHQTKKEMKLDGVNEDDLLEIKQDISSLRFELREERRTEIERSSGHIDSVKRDIMRSLSKPRRDTRLKPPQVAYLPIVPPQRADAEKHAELSSGGESSDIDDEAAAAGVRSAAPTVAWRRARSVAHPPPRPSPPDRSLDALQARLLAAVREELAKALGNYLNANVPAVNERRGGERLAASVDGTPLFDTHMYTEC